MQYAAATQLAFSDPEAALGFEGILIPGTRACPRSFVGASVCLSNGH